MASRIVTAIIVLGGLFFLLPGVLAVADPERFFDEFATWEPYNEHFIHDIGAFMIGIGAMLLLSLLWSDAKLVALAGATVGAMMHLVTHVVDHGHGGMDSDPYMFGAAAVILGAGAALRWTEKAGQPVSLSAGQQGGDDSD